MDRLFHIARRTDWEQARQHGEYRISTPGHALAEVGYIHCSFADQVMQIAAWHFRPGDDIVLLAIDPALLQAEVRVENLEGGSELYPHVYGPLPVAAVSAVERLVHAPSGGFKTPAVLAAEAG